MPTHVHRHFEDQLEELQDKILRLGGFAESAIGRATTALMERDTRKAREVVDADDEADELETEIDQLCLEILARHQPVGKDLRFLTTALKVTPDLERIADLAASIATRTIEMNEEPRPETLMNVPLMAERAQLMLRRALDAFVARDAHAAKEVIALDRELNSWMEQTFRVSVTFMLEEPRMLTRALRLMMVAKSLERIGDQVTNVCEMIVYMAKGEVIRHREIPALREEREARDAPPEP